MLTRSAPCVDQVPAIRDRRVVDPDATAGVLYLDAMTDEPLTYADSGVDIEAGDKAVELLKESVRRATRPEVIGGLGGFAGMFDAASLARMTRPVLVTSTDGVGTKVSLAQQLDIHETIGFDLVAMVVDDIVVSGAEPLFMTDYIACGRVVPERIARIVSGIAKPASRRGSPSSAARPPSTQGCSSLTSTTLPVPPPGSSSTPTSWARTVSDPVTQSSRWPRAACTPTATHS